MGFNNPCVSWTELERTLSDRHRKPTRSEGDGGDSPAWSYHRPSYVPPADLRRRAFKSLKLLDAATSLADLGNLPGNRLHALKDDRAGQHSISINLKYRICFVWKDGDAYDVEIVDYH